MSSSENDGNSSEFAAGGSVVLRLRGEIRCGVRGRALAGETRRFFLVDDLTERITGTVCYMCYNCSESNYQKVVVL